MIFLSALRDGAWATYLSETTWSLPWSLSGDTKLNITRAEVEELEKLGYVGNYSYFNPHVLMDDWWSSKITEAGLRALQSTRGDVDRDQN